MQQVRKAIGIVVLVLTGFTAMAQRDTTKPKAVDITSSFRPALHDAAKINFNATPPVADSSKPRLQYDIPEPNLALAYQPGSLKPLALQIDSNGRFNSSNYVKIGFGSLRTPYMQAGFSYGDGNTAGVNIFAKHVASEGKRDFQDFSNTQVRLSGFYKAAQNMEWTAALAMVSDRTYKYGYQPESLSFPTDSIRQKFQTISARVGVHNINKTEFGLNYSPEIKIDVFSDYLKNSESNTVVNLPLEKRITKEFTANLGVTFDLTRLSLKKQSAIDNTVWYISPSVSYNKANLRLLGGIRPSWDNKEFKMFPNILAEIGSKDRRVNFQLGWTGYVRKTTYQYLESQNPWLWAPTSLLNTWVEERFAGFKGALDDHFTYSAKVAFNKLTNQPLFINDTSALGDGKSFQVVNAKRINVLNLSAQVGYNVEEKFSLISTLNLNQFTGIEGQDKAWGMLPLEFNTALRLQIIKDLWLKGDVFAFGGGKYMQKDGGDANLDGAFDLNAGLEFRITKNINLWTQFNNIFNKQYQRWNQYPVYGFNFVGGIIFSFDQKH